MAFVQINEPIPPQQPASQHPLQDPQPWKLMAKCLGLGRKADVMFFPEQGGSVRQAKIVCGGCSVKPECLEYALTVNEKHGVWGGATERERRVMRKARRESGS